MNLNNQLKKILLFYWIKLKYVKGPFIAPKPLDLAINIVPIFALINVFQFKDYL